MPARTKTAPGPRRWISQAEAAEHLGVTPRTIRRLIADGELTAYRPAGRHRTIRIDLSELDGLMRPIPGATPRSEA